MTVVKLSFAIMLIHWCNKVVDWFMLFFEDSELYWNEDKEKKTTVDAYSRSLNEANNEKKRKQSFKRVSPKSLLKSKKININNSFLSKRNSTPAIKLKPFFQFRSMKETIINMFD